MDDAVPETFSHVCPIESVAENEAIVEEIDGVEVAVIRVADEIYAIENVCPHQGGPLGQGKVEDGCLFCPWHGWQFDIETGEHVHGAERASTFPVRVDDSDVYIAL